MLRIAIGGWWERFAEAAVEQGRYASAEAVVHEGLRLLEVRDSKLQALRETLEASIARGGSNTDADVSETIKKRLEMRQ